jgi:hypothetical protein
VASTDKGSYFTLDRTAPAGSQYTRCRRRGSAPLPLLTGQSTDAHWHEHRHKNSLSGTVSGLWDRSDREAEEMHALQRGGLLRPNMPAVGSALYILGILCPSLTRCPLQPEPGEHTVTTTVACAVLVDGEH